MDGRRPQQHLPVSALRPAVLALCLGALVGCSETTMPVGRVEEQKAPAAVSLTVTGWGEGAGTIRADPYIDCQYDGGQVWGACTATVNAGTSLSFHALPRDTAVNGIAFLGWAGSCTQNDGTTCHVTAGASPVEVSAGFMPTTRLHGAVFGPGSQGEDLGLLEVRLAADGEQRGAVPVSASGSFDGLLLGTVRDAGSVSVTVDVRGASERTYFPSFRSMKPWELADPVRLVLVPRVWRIAHGTFVGETVDVDLNEVLGVEPSFYLTTGQGQLTKTWQFQVQSVTFDRLPLTLGFDLAVSAANVLEIDVERYWRRIRELEEAVGFDLFEEPSGGATPAVRIAVSPGACGKATACTNLAGGDPYLEVGAQIFHESVEQFRADRGVVAHELTHVLGMGHTCRWNSLMTLGSDDCETADKASIEPTPRDVAYLHLALAVNSMQKLNGMPAYGSGIMGAWNGQRVVIDGLAPWIPPNCAQCSGASGRDGT